MACPAVTTGPEFLVRTLAHLDCQAQTLGSFGFGALASPGSPASLALTALLTLFIAIFAVRMLTGTATDTRDVVSGVLKIGIVLTLALSWPAFRTLAYDTVLSGPAEVASAITPSTLPDTGAGFAGRLQNIDTGMVSLTTVGTGRQAGSQELEGQDDAFRGVALEDETALGWARTVYLGSVIGSLAILRIAGGLLLAVAPLIAGLLLFDFARGLFAGWLRGLVLVAMGSLGISLLLAVEVAVLEPWLIDTLNRRNLGYATPSAPTELLALALAFAIAAAGLLVLLGKVAFHNSWTFRYKQHAGTSSHREVMRESRTQIRGAAAPARSARALTVSTGVRNLLRHEQTSRGAPRTLLIKGPSEPSRGAGVPATTPIGSSWRRTSQRTTSAQTSRDKSR